MFLEIPDFLLPGELGQLRQIAQGAQFVDGKITNPHNTSKNNLQIDTGDQGYQRSAQIGIQAFKRSEAFVNFAMPKQLATPLLARYEPGMKYGAHFDVAYMGQPGNQMRSDLSCTIFLNEPASYEGGELAVHLGSATRLFKLAPGAAIVYPSLTLHEVTPVRSGQRLVMITFIQSQIRDMQQREIIYELGEVSALAGLTMQFEHRMMLDKARANLMRMWAD